MIQIRIFDVVILIISVVGISIMTIILYMVTNHQKPAIMHIQQQIHVHQAIVEEEEIPNIANFENIIELEDNPIERMRFDRLVARENPPEPEHGAEKMTKKMLMKAEKRRIKAQQRLDAVAWVQMKNERDRLKEERYLERYGQSDSDSIDEDVDHAQPITVSAKPRSITDYNHYVDIFPQILENFKASKLVNIDALQEQFDIQSSALCITIIQYFETSGLIHGLFLHDNSVYCQLEIDEMKYLAENQRSKKIFTLDDVASSFGEVVTLSY